MLWRMKAVLREKCAQLITRKFCAKHCAIFSYLWTDWLTGILIERNYNIYIELDCCRYFYNLGGCTCKITPVDLSQSDLKVVRVKLRDKGWGAKVKCKIQQMFTVNYIYWKKAYLFTQSHQRRTTHYLHRAFTGEMKTKDHCFPHAWLTVSWFVFLKQNLKKKCLKDKYNCSLSIYIFNSCIYLCLDAKVIQSSLFRLK